ncbi:tRNA (adenosine(37)-N6)-threonylcarbamoyltransferase complex dimerization subunit type 1 TsaB [Woeseia oceani]|uniref:tRNA threonylcarbamoyladenosine biosynthesis protein TsaB n=1 Tax=Woeseia oceani TaxID=1548547 RepID=A0A193LF23_9GAMM|nr:tRNA (adenosine(37)-N6)-threonylcarbamoyltransferase complex dimerization subunit type 1 TsaB [Woeseia oceani]ANO51068.1 tRNA N6-adenosine(37)-N6-threonylcarbamoyltransferase complex dimerization subunit TsaB [Woeseia oceani]
MNVLALDTSTLACTVALQSDDAMRSRHAERPREHTRLLLPMIQELLAEAGINSAQLDAVVLGNGPGSFIGMRIAASVAQGICFASGALLVPVSSLATVAAAALRESAGQPVLVAQDAHMNEVYLAAYGGDADAPEELWPASLQSAGVLAGQLPGALPAGAGWQRYPDLLAANSDWLGSPGGILYPRAEELLRLGLRALENGQTVAPERLEPAYLREQVATPPAG